MALVNPSMVDVSAFELVPRRVSGTSRNGTPELCFSNSDQGDTRLAFKLDESAVADGHIVRETWPTLVFSYPAFLGLREHKLDPPDSLGSK